MDQVSVRIADKTHVSEAGRASGRMAKSLGLGAVAEGNLAIVVSELARNVLLHGGSGEVILQPGQEPGQAPWVDVFALDRGPGIHDVSSAMQDGYSSAGTPGTGLGAIRRLTSAMEFYTKPKEGTAVFARVRSGGNDRPEKLPTTGSICVPLPGETCCGDAWEFQDQPERRVIIVVDGLGHGAGAADAAQEALQAFRESRHRSPKQILEVAHGRLQKTRGAAVSVAEIDFDRQIVRYAGIGNIAATILTNGKSRSMISHNGIVGHITSTMSEFTFPWEKDAFLIMHSDGLSARWNLGSYQGLQFKPASLIAAVLYRDFKRGRDDATVVVSRQAEAA